MNVANDNSYRVTIGDFTHVESTMAACKALVNGLSVSWTISQWRTNSVTKQEGHCGIGQYNGKIFAFKMGRCEFEKTASRWMLETFKKSGMRKDANNTTYVERDFDGKWVQVGTINKLEKLLISMGF